MGFNVRIKGCVGSVFVFFFDKNFLYLLLVPQVLVGLRGWCGVYVLGVVVCLVGRSGVWLIRRTHSGDGSRGLFSGWMRLAGSSLSLVFCQSRVPRLVLDLGSASAVLERDSEQV